MLPFGCENFLLPALKLNFLAEQILQFLDHFGGNACDDKFLISLMFSIVAVYTCTSLDASPNASQITQESSTLALH